MSFESDVRSLFDNYNNVSQVTAREFVDYIFTLVPAVGGVIRDSSGNASIDIDNRRLIGQNGLTQALSWTNDGARVGGNLVVTGNINQNGGGPAIDPNTRTLKNSGLVTTFDWDAATLFDTAGDLSIQLQDRRLIDQGGQQSADWDARILTDGGAPSVDWSARNLLDTSGAIANLDWSAGIGFFGTPSVGKQLVANTPMVVLADVIAVVDDIRSALSDYGLIQLV